MLAALVVIAAVSACAEESSGDPAAEATIEEPASDEAMPDREETAGQENAREAAEGYVELSGFSKEASSSS